MLSILQAIWQADGAFPSGSFAFSYGIEGVVALRPELDQAGLAELTATIIRQRWPTCDRIAQVKAFRPTGDLDAIADIDGNVEASTFGSARDVKGELGLSKSMLPVKGTRKLSKCDMPWNRPVPRSPSIPKPSMCSSTVCLPPANQRAKCRWRAATC
jgi:hypothetical protein